MNAILFLLGSLLSLEPSYGAAEESVHVVSRRKQSLYFPDGVFIGGDSSVERFALEEVRHSQNAGYERLVLDLRRPESGKLEPLDLSAPYLVHLNKSLQRLEFTFWGKAHLLFEEKKWKEVLKKSAILGEPELYPTLFRDRWMFVIPLKKPAELEMVELSKPLRIVLDLR